MVHFVMHFTTEELGSPWGANAKFRCEQQWRLKRDCKKMTIDHITRTYDACNYRYRYIRVREGIVGALEAAANSSASRPQSYNGRLDVSWWAAQEACMHSLQDLSSAASSPLSSRVQLAGLHLWLSPTHWLMCASSRQFMDLQLYWADESFILCSGGGRKSRLHLDFF